MKYVLQQYMTVFSNTFCTVCKMYLLLFASNTALATSTMAVWATSNAGSNSMLGMLNETSTSNLIEEKNVSTCKTHQTLFINIVAAF